MNKFYVSGEYEWGGTIGTQSYLVLCQKCVRKRKGKVGVDGLGTRWTLELVSDKSADGEACVDCGAED